MESRDQNGQITYTSVKEYIILWTTPKIKDLIGIHFVVLISEDSYWKYLIL